mmetsp:Transcript_30724/g.47115  ORF Transcript_30724/g.47115 Transcript_30724/m.47115 type:complete len:112 (+) Transcript_30724:1000-1335(+)
MPKKREGDDDPEDPIDRMLNEIPKYVTLNQVNVRIAGGTDKLLVVRDVTSIVMNEKITHTKREMNKITDLLMHQIEEHSTSCEMRLQKMDPFIVDQGKPICEDSSHDIQKL